MGEGEDEGEGGGTKRLWLFLGEMPRRFAYSYENGIGVHLSVKKCNKKPTIRWGLGKTPRRSIRKRCRYSSFQKFEDAFDTVLIRFNASKAVGCSIFGRFSNFD